MAKRAAREPVDPNAPYGIRVLRAAANEARGFLTTRQYDFAVELVRELVAWNDRDARSQMDLDHIRGVYWELRETGGVLGRINLRIYFAVDGAAQEIVILKAWNKRVDGPIPPHIVDAIEERWEVYRAGGHRKGIITYRRRP